MSTASEPEARERIYHRILEQARPCWLALVGILFLALLTTPLSLLLPLPLKIAVDSVIGSHPLPQLLAKALPRSATESATAKLIVAACMLMGISILFNLQSLASWLLQTYTGEKLVFDLRTRLFWHVQRLSLSFYERRGTRDTAYRIEHDAPAIQFIIVQGMIPFLTAIVSFTAMMYVTARISWRLACIAVALSPVLFLLARRSTLGTRSGWKRVKELDSSAMLVMNEALAGVRAVKAFGQESQEERRFIRRSTERMWQQVRLASIQAGFHVVMALAIAGGTTAALVVGTIQVRSGQLTIGELLLAMAYIAQLYDPLRTISSKIPEMESWRASIDRALSLLDEVPDVIDRPGAVSLGQATGAVLVRNVSFEYRRGNPVLHDLSFEVAPGKRVGIVGPSGSGKSTLISLLMRSYDVCSGEILLDGRDIRDYKLADLCRQFSIVGQQPIMFSTTVAGNIAYGRPEAAREEIIAAAAAANAHEFILRLPRGYDTEVGERGVQLSGGEAQRITLARAFLKHAPILILDEPTSALDIATESAILSATDALMKGRTCFIIAHRLSTIENCDVVLVLEQGRLVRIDVPPKGRSELTAGGPAAFAAIGVSN